MTELSDLIDKSIWMLSKTTIEDAKTRDFLSHVTAELRTAKFLMNQSDRFLVAFSGMTNMGKSTLLNALLGSKIAPVANQDCSARAVEYRYSDDPKIYLADVYPLKEIRFETESELKQALNELSTMKNPENAIGREKMVVELQSPILQNGLIVCDLPGFLATDGTTGEEGKGLHDDDILEYLQQYSGHLRLMIVSDSNIPKESVLQFIRENMANVQLSLVINHRHEEIEERKRDLEKAWQVGLNRVLDFQYINAKDSIKEMTAEKESLIQYLNQYSSADGRLEIAEKTLESVFRNVGVYLRDFEHISKVAGCFTNTCLAVVGNMLRDYGRETITKAFEEMKS